MCVGKYEIKNEHIECVTPNCIKWKKKKKLSKNNMTESKEPYKKCVSAVAGAKLIITITIIRSLERVTQWIIFWWWWWWDYLDVFVLLMNKAMFWLALVFVTTGSLCHSYNTVSASPGQLSVVQRNVILGVSKRVVKKHLFLFAFCLFCPLSDCRFRAL